MEHWKKDLLCPVCGVEFKGTAKATMCSARCRTRLARMLAEGQKPQFYLQSKSRGQKLPKLDGRLKSPPKSNVLSFEEKMVLKKQIEAEISELEKKPPPEGMAIRVWWQMRDSQIAELKNQIR